MAIPILMYHSVADEGPGPVSLKPDTFRDQLAVLSDAGARGITLSEYVTAHRANHALPRGSVVLTFDDAYRDFEEDVFPQLEAYGWRATVFVPILPVDDDRPWDCGDGHARPLMTWQAIGELASRGIEFAAHSMSHTDLTALDAADAREEIVASGERLYERTGRVAEGFAPPRGRLTPALRREISMHYGWCAGTRMNAADQHSDLFDLPRIEMWYFRNIERWRRYVSQGWTPYFALRRALRAVGSRLRP